MDVTKGHKRPRKTRSPPPPTSTATTSARNFFIQGYEAQLIRGQEEVARQMGMREEEGGRLIRWMGEVQGSGSGSGSRGGLEGDGRDGGVYVDRYDILHLLTSIPSPPSTPPSPSGSLGWSDLPSDAEDTFYLDADVEQEYERVKKRRRIDGEREKRVKMLEEMEEGEKNEVGVAPPSGRDVWGGDDEEPPEAIRQLMTHTAASLKSSPNPQILELRILTHHSSDTRFEFLKGRYKSTWAAIKAGKPLAVKGEKKVPVVVEKKTGGLTGLMGDYGDSNSEEESEEGEPEAPVEDVPPPPPSPPSHPLEPPDGPPSTEAADAVDSQAELLARRREKARLWAEARKKETDT